MNDLPFHKIVRAIEKVIDRRLPDRDTMIVGTVSGVSPLEIDIGGGVSLTEEFLFLGQMCRPHKVTVPHTHIVDAHLTEMSPSIGSVGAGMVAGTAFEQAQAALAKAEVVEYKTLRDEGRENDADNGSVGAWKEGTGAEETNVVAKEDLGRGSVSTSIIVAGQASVTDDSVMITDNGHKHIVGRQTTKDAHFPGSEYEESVTIEIEPKLKKGDRVLMFAFNNFQRYYVAERLEEGA